MRFRNVKNLKYKMQKQPSIGFLKKRYYGFFLFLKKKKKKPKNQKLINGQSHRKTSSHILLKVTSSISISQEHFPRPQEDIFSRTTLSGHFQIVRCKTKIDLRDYFNKTSLFVKNFKINHQKLINKSKDSQKLKRVPYVLKNHNIYSVFSSTIKFFKSEILSKKLPYDHF